MGVWSLCDRSRSAAGRAEAGTDVRMHPPDDVAGHAPSPALVAAVLAFAWARPWS